MKISKAIIKDSEAIVHLLNSAYRGEPSAKGWTTEAHLISGEIRTNEGTVLELMKQNGSVILKYETDEGTIAGTVNLQQHQNKLYLGMFAVMPGMQGAGIGKQLMQAAELYAQETGCTSIYMTVISVRSELIDWYKRQGYIDTGERKPFHEDRLTGRHLQPLEFMVLEKSV